MQRRRKFPLSERSDKREANDDDGGGKRFLEDGVASSSSVFSLFFTSFGRSESVRDRARKRRVEQEPWNGAVVAVAVAANRRDSFVRVVETILVACAASRFPEEDPLREVEKKRATNNDGCGSEIVFGPGNSKRETDVEPTAIFTFYVVFDLHNFMENN